MLRTHILKFVDNRKTLIASCLIVVSWFVLLESLSIRRVRAATFSVLNTNDSGAGSLRQAIASINKVIGYEFSSVSEEVLLVADRNEGFNFEQASNDLKPFSPATCG